MTVEDLMKALAEHPAQAEVFCQEGQSLLVEVKTVEPIFSDAYGQAVILVTEGE